jgi:hypothetical protein
MARRGAGGSVPQAIAHCAQPADRSVELLSLRRKKLPVNPRLAVAGEHARDFIEGKARRASQGDER